MSQRAPTVNVVHEGVSSRSDHGRSFGKVRYGGSRPRRVRVHRTGSKIRASLIISAANIAIDQMFLQLARVYKRQQPLHVSERPQDGQPTGSTFLSVKTVLD